MHVIESGILFEFSSPGNAVSWRIPSTPVAVPGLQSGRGCVICRPGLQGRDCAASRSPGPGSVTEDVLFVSCRPEKRTFTKICIARLSDSQFHQRRLLSVVSSLSLLQLHSTMLCRSMFLLNSLVLFSRSTNVHSKQGYSLTLGNIYAAAPGRAGRFRESQVTAISKSLQLANPLRYVRDASTLEKTPAAI